MGKFFHPHVSAFVDFRSILFAASVKFPFLAVFFMNFKKGRIANSITMKKLAQAAVVVVRMLVEMVQKQW